MVSEVEGRLRDRDEQQTTWLSNKLDDLKQILQSQASFLREPEEDRETLAEDNGHAMPTQADVLRREPEDATILTVADNVTSPALPHAESLVAEQSRENVARDVYYSGVGGALLGAAVVTCWNALFR